MSSSAHLLNETDSAAFAGVGIETIREYERVGLLRAVPDRDSFSYGESDLRRVFQIPTDRQAPQRAAQQPAPEPQKAPEPTSEPEKPAVEKAAEPETKSEIRAEERPAQERRAYREEVTYSAPGAGNSYDLLEITRGLREQVQMLREERDWLRKRVETLEVRLDRDQMLLLSETKNVRQLIQAQPRKSFWALPWLGKRS